MTSILKLEYMTDIFDDWNDALLEAGILSENGWMVVGSHESDDKVRLVFCRQLEP